MDTEPKTGNQEEKDEEEEEGTEAPEYQEIDIQSKVEKGEQNEPADDTLSSEESSSQEEYEAEADKDESEVNSGNKYGRFGKLSDNAKVAFLQRVNISVLDRTRQVREGLKEIMRDIKKSERDSDEGPSTSRGMPFKGKSELLEKLRKLRKVAKKPEKKLKRVVEHVYNVPDEEAKSIELKFANLQHACVVIFDGLREFSSGLNVFPDAESESDEGPMTFAQKSDLLKKLLSSRSHAELLNKKLEQARAQINDLDSSLRFTERVASVNKQFNVLDSVLTKSADSVERQITFLYKYLSEDAEPDVTEGEERGERREGENDRKEEEERVGEHRHVFNRFEAEENYFENDENESEDANSDVNEEEKQRERLIKYQRFQQWVAEDKDNSMFPFNTEFF